MEPSVGVGCSNNVTLSGKLISLDKLSSEIIEKLICVVESPIFANSIPDSTLQLTTPSLISPFEN